MPPRGLSRLHGWIYRSRLHGRNRRAGRRVSGSGTVSYTHLGGFIRRHCNPSLPPVLHVGLIIGLTFPYMLPIFRNGDAPCAPPYLCLFYHSREKYATVFPRRMPYRLVFTIHFRFVKTEASTMKADAAPDPVFPCFLAKGDVYKRQVSGGICPVRSFCQRSRTRRWRGLSRSRRRREARHQT